MDIRRAASLARSWAIWIVVACLGAGVVAFAVSSVLPKSYESQTRLLVGQALSAANPDVDLFQSATNLALTYADIARGPNLQQRVIDSLGLDTTVERLQQQVSIRAVRDLPFIEIAASAADPETAAAIAAGISDELLAIAPTVGSGDPTFVEEDLLQVRAEIERVREEVSSLVAIPERTPAQEARLETLLERLTTLRSFYATYVNNSVVADANRLAVVDDAIVPTAPASPRPLLNAAIAALMALLVVAGLAVLSDRLDDRLTTSEEVERVAGLPTLATVFAMPGDRGRAPFYRLVTVLYPRSPAAEAFRSLRTNIEFADVDSSSRTITITSSSTGEGKTVVASNLAVVLAQSGRRTILVDADLRLPGVHGMFSIPAGLGLSDLVRRDDLKVVDVLHQTEEANLRIVTAGTLPPNPAELLGSARAAAVFDQLVAAADVVVIDTPPVGVVTDGAIVAARSDATILVIELMRTSERALRRGRESLANVNAKVIGAVINKVPKDGASDVYFGAYADHEARSSEPTLGAAPMPAATASHDAAPGSPAPQSYHAAPRGEGSTMRLYESPREKRSRGEPRG